MNFQLISRRNFLKATGISSSSLYLYAIAGCSPNTFSLNNTVSPWLYLSLDKDHFHLILPRTEMGQDIATSFAVILAEEMAFPLEKIKIQFADADSQLGDQLTVGSASIRTWWKPLRQMGAQIRAQTLKRAAKSLSVPVEECMSENGLIKHPGSRQSLNYLALLKQKPISSQVEAGRLTDTSKFKLIGKDTPSIFVRPKVTGGFRYLGDYPNDNLVSVLTIAYRPNWPLPDEKTLAALKHSFALDDVFLMHHELSGFSSRVVLIGDKTWPLLKCKNKVEQTLKNWLVQNVKPKKSAFESMVAEQNQEVIVTEKLLSLTFYTPPVAHAPLETETAIVHFQENKCEVWAPSQAPQRAQKNIAKTLNLQEQQVTLHTTALGGGFGRKRYDDYLIEAALISRALFNKNSVSKVKLFWTREDDLNREFYRPATLQSLSWNSSESKSIKHTLIESQNPGGQRTSSEQELFTFLDWDILSERLGIPCETTVGIWRSVAHGYLAFALCSFIDELSYRHNEDPIEFYKKHIQSLSPTERIKGFIDPGTRFQPDRLHKVVDEVKSRSEWGAEKTQNIALGFAAYTCFKSYIALVVKVTQYNEELVVEKVWASVDCGITINPNGLKAQIEGGILFGLSACLYSEVIPNKDSQMLNFDSFIVARMENTPEIEVYIQSNQWHPSGAGELGVPPIAPAIANAVRSLTTKRFLKMPFMQKSKLNESHTIDMNTNHPALQEPA